MTLALGPELRALLESPALGHVVTINPDGSPQASVVWLGLDGDDVVFASMGLWRKVQNLQRDPRVVVTIEGAGTNAVGMVEHAVLQGTAEVTEGGAAALLNELAQTYVGPGTEFIPTDDPPPGFVVRITPTRVGGVGPWAG